MVRFTSGILRSNVHRVVNPPGLQADSTRMSLGMSSLYLGLTRLDR